MKEVVQIIYSAKWGNLPKNVCVPDLLKMIIYVFAEYHDRKTDEMIFAIFVFKLRQKKNMCVFQVSLLSFFAQTLNILLCNMSKIYR